MDSGFGVVVKAIDTLSNDLVVIKVMQHARMAHVHETKEGKSITTMAENEEYMMRQITSKFVVTFYDSFQYNSYMCVSSK